MMCADLCYVLIILPAVILYSFCTHLLTIFYIFHLLLCFYYISISTLSSAIMTESRDYDALAQDIINLEDIITSCERNANILRMLRDGHPNWNKKLFIVNEDNDDGNMNDFLVEEGDDLGWLGYFIGKSEVIKYLHIYCSFPEEGDNYFFDGMSRNRSIKELEVNSEIGGGSWIISLGSFLANNHNLSQLEFQGIMIGPEGAQNLASALGRMNHNSLEELSMDQCGIGDECLAKIAAALRLQSQLKKLDLYGNNIGRNSCIALGNTLSRWPASNNLEVLNLHSNFIDDEGLQALVSGMMNCHSLKQLDIGGDRSITAAGLRSLSPLLQSESHHSLEILSLYDTNLGDDGAITLAEGLRGNKSLKQLYFDVNVARMTSVGWSVFSKLLCDTSTINSTNLSHHTLTNLGGYMNGGAPEDIVKYLRINNRLVRKNAAIYKILQSHPDLDMEHFFTLKMKFLPSVMSWFERVEPIEEHLINWELINESERSCQSRKLSAMYKFVRAMPDLAVIGYWEGRMIHIEAEKRRLEYEEEIIRERLGLSGQPMDEPRRNKRMRLN